MIANLDYIYCTNWNSSKTSGNHDKWLIENATITRPKCLHKFHVKQYLVHLQETHSLAFTITQNLSSKSPLRLKTNSLLWTVTKFKNQATYIQCKIAHGKHFQSERKERVVERMAGPKKDLNEAREALHMRSWHQGFVVVLNLWVATSCGEGGVKWSYYTVTFQIFRS